MKEYTGSNSYTSTRTNTLLNNVIEINRTLTPKYNNDRFYTDSVDSLYQCYLNERIFNLRLFYTLYKIIDYVNQESPYRLDQGIYYSTSTNISNDFIDKLYRVFFNTEDIININLSTNLTPAYFRFNRRNSPNQPMNQIRNNYIDLLRYQYWEEDMPIFEKN